MTSFRTAGGNFRQAPRTRFATPKPKQSAEHYRSEAHAKWAADVKRRAGFKCEDCGAVNVKLYADHVLELQDRPDLALDPRNGRCLCAKCHGTKTARQRDARLTAVAAAKE